MGKVKNILWYKYLKISVNIWIGLYQIYLLKSPIHYPALSLLHFNNLKYFKTFLY